jgi:protein required for attachment to host cells
MNRQELINHIEELDISEFAKDCLIHALEEMEQIV